MTVTSAQRWSSTEVALLTGASYRQLDYWCRVGLIPDQPNDMGSGSRRQWSYEQIRHVRCLVSLTGAGVEGDSLRAAVAVLADPGLDWFRPLSLALNEHATLRLDLPALR